MTKVGPAYDILHGLIVSLWTSEGLNILNFLYTRKNP